MKIAVTGSNGLLGQHLVQLLLQNGYLIVAIGKGADRSSFSEHTSYRYYNVDLTDQSSLEKTIRKEAPAVLIHGAAITQVDECELNQEKCEQVNVQGTINALTAARFCCQHFIYISTDFVFDGSKGNYSEEDTAGPISFYGRTKQLAEEQVISETIPWAIVRTCLVYGNTISGTRNNIITWVKNELEQGKKIKVVTDQFRTPTYVEDLAKGIMLIIQKKSTGIFHISGNTLLTPYDMAIQTADFFGLPKQLITKVTADVFSQPAKRPPKTGFNISKAQSILGFAPLSFSEGLNKMFNG